SSGRSKGPNCPPINHAAIPQTKKLMRLNTGVAAR
ncbi:MAG: hypothetical protein RLY20_3369, partial [Verrucomicrobiota bacterium]